MKFPFLLMMMMIIFLKKPYFWIEIEAGWGEGKPQSTDNTSMFFPL